MVTRTFRFVQSEKIFRINLIVGGLTVTVMLFFVINGIWITIESELMRAILIILSVCIALLTVYSFTHSGSLKVYDTGVIRINNYYGWIPSSLKGKPVYQVIGGGEGFSGLSARFMVSDIASIVRTQVHPSQESDEEFIAPSYVAEDLTRMLKIILKEPAHPFPSYGLSPRKSFTVSIEDPQDFIDYVLKLQALAKT